MKKIVSLVLVLVLSLLICVIPRDKAYSYAGQEVTVTLDGKAIDFPDDKPFINADGRTVVPVRFIAENMGCKVDWEGQNQIVTIGSNKTEIILKIGENSALVTDVKTKVKEKKEFDTNAFIKGERTFVPLRFVSETLGLKVNWDDNTKTVIIATKPYEYSGSVKLISDEEFSKLYNNILTSPDYFKIDAVNKRLIYYYYNPDYPKANFSDYILKENINPNINTQVYALAKLLIGDNHYVDVSYTKNETHNGPSYAQFIYAGTWNELFEGKAYFKIGLYDNMYGSSKEDGREFSDKEFAFISIKNILTSTKKGHVTLSNIDTNRADSIKKSLIIIFGDTSGTKIYKYLMDEYINIVNTSASTATNYTKKTVKIDNVQLDVFDLGHPLVYFSYVQ